MRSIAIVLALFGLASAKTFPFLELSGGMAYPVLDGNKDDALDPSISVRAGGGVSFDLREQYTFSLGGYYALDRFSIVEKNDESDIELTLLPRVIELEATLRYQPSLDVGIGILGGLQFNMPTKDGTYEANGMPKQGYSDGIAVEGNIQKDANFDQENFLSIRLGLQYIITETNCIHLSWYVPVGGYIEESGSSIALNRILLGASFGL